MLPENTVTSTSVTSFWLTKNFLLLVKALVVDKVTDNGIGNIFLFIMTFVHSLSHLSRFAGKMGNRRTEQKSYM